MRYDKYQLDVRLQGEGDGYYQEGGSAQVGGGRGSK